MEELEYYKQLSEIQEKQIVLYKEQLILKEMLIVEFKSLFEMYKELKYLNKI